MRARLTLLAALLAALALPLQARKGELFEIYKKYGAAIEAGDLKTAKKYVSAGKAARLADMSESEALAALHTLSPKEKLALHREVIDGDDATLIVVAEVMENSSAGHVQFVREDGDWKILSEMWNIGGDPEDPPGDVRQPKNDKERAALRKLRERGFPIPTADFLVMSAATGDLDTVKLFLEAGYPADTADGGMPAIVSAAMGGYGEIVLHLMEAGADVNAQGENQMTALMGIADQCDATEVVKKLLAGGAKADLQSGGGTTALQLAEWSECAANAEAIRAATK